MFLWLKRLSGSMADGQWFSGRPDIAPLDLERDWPDAERLLRANALPHSRTDVEGWLSTPGSVGLVARKDDRFAGFMVGHPVGKVAHIDTVCIDFDFRKGSIARPLYFRGVNALKVHGSSGFVAHARDAPGALLELIGYTRGARFDLVGIEVGEFTVAGGHRGELVDGDELPFEGLIALDEATFGARREAWINHLRAREDAELYGFLKNGELTAALILERSGGGLIVRLAEGREFKDISNLMHVVMAMNSGRQIQCWVREDSPLAAMFTSLDFQPIANVDPFYEYRNKAADPGSGPGVLQLSWW